MYYIGRVEQYSGLMFIIILLAVGTHVLYRCVRVGACVFARACVCLRARVCVCACACACEISIILCIG